MSGIGFWEMIFLAAIGLVVLGPKRLPQIASQLGTWVGQARRMTRALKRQLEEELDLEKELDIRPTIHPPPRDDDGYSPLHSQPPKSIAGLDLNEPGDAAEAADPADAAEHAGPGDAEDGETSEREQRKEA